MADGELRLVQEILSFRVLIERVIAELLNQRPVQSVHADRLARRFKGDEGRRRAAKGGVHVTGGHGKVSRRHAPREAAPTDTETAALLDKLVGGHADPSEKQRLLELLTIADSDLARSRSEVGAGRYL